MKKILAALAVAAITVISSGAPALAAPANPQSTDPDKNHANYWEDYTSGDVCTKVEMTGNVKTYTLPVLTTDQQYTLLVVKAGSGVLANTLYSSPTAGIPYDHSTGKDLSHIIFCVGAAGSSVNT